ncbi:MAG: VCBS domain-containing protein, partial [Prochlorococcaceae cyanobacterium]
DLEIDWSDRGDNNDWIGADYLLLATSGGSPVALRIDVLAGSNDVPEITSTESAAAGTVIEAGLEITGVTSAGGQLSASDADAYAPLRWELRSSASTPYGSFAISADGTWTYTLSNEAAATEALRAGESVTDTVLAVVVDEFGATASQTLQVLIRGSNDAPVIVSNADAASGQVREAGTLEPGQADTGGQLSASDLDQASGLSWELLGDGRTAYGTFAIDASSGAWTYRLDDAAAATEALIEGSSAIDSVVVVVRDEQGATATATLQVTISGSNDAPVITSAADEARGSVQEAPADGSGSGSSSSTGGQLNAIGQISASDVDQPTGLIWAPLASNPTSPYGQFAIDASSGAWSYTLNDSPATNALAEGQSVVETYTVVVRDAFGATASETIAITIHGSNDDAAISGTATGSLTEAGTAGPGIPTASGTLTLSDADAGEGLFEPPAALNGTYGAFSFNTETGAWSYTLDNNRPATELLQEGATASDSLLVRSLDGTASQTITVTISGSADLITGAVIDGYLAGAVVYLDANGNRMQDPNETWTTTNAEGRYAYDFGALSGVLVAQGGTDVSTGLAFSGTLLAPLGAAVITPLTTLVVALMDAGAGSLAEAEALLKKALGLPQEVDLLRFDPFAVSAASPEAPLALAVQQAAAQVANVLAVSAALGLAPETVRSQLAAQLQTAAGGGTSLNLADAAVLTPLLGGNAPLAAQLAFSNQQVADATDLAGGVAGQLSAQESLVVNLQTIGQGVPFPTVLGNRRSNRLVGSEANDVMRGFAPNDPSRGRKQKDKLTGLGGDDLFQLGDERGAFYDDGKAGKAGKGDYAWITDFSPRDRIQLHGSAADYVLKEVRFKKRRMTALYRNDGSGTGADPNGWDKRDELIGYVQLAEGGPLNLLNPGQFLYIGPLPPPP